MRCLNFGDRGHNAIYGGGGGRGSSRNGSSRRRTIEEDEEYLAVTQEEREIEGKLWISTLPPSSSVFYEWRKKSLESGC